MLYIFQCKFWLLCMTSYKIFVSTNRKPAPSLRFHSCDNVFIFRSNGCSSRGRCLFRISNQVLPEPRQAALDGNSGCSSKYMGFHTRVEENPALLVSLSKVTC